MNILITGGCGFVGSSLAILLKKKYPDYSITCFDNLKRRGSELNITRLRDMDIRFVHGDIRIITDLDEIGHIDLLIEAAAEPSVLAGLNEGTNYVVETNLNGTVNCLNYARKHKAKFIFLSTSRVYPIERIDSANFIKKETRFAWTNEQRETGISKKGVSEELSLVGYRSLYGSTKLSSELLINEYHHMFGLETLINRCGVITGPYQMGKVDQGVVVLWAARHFWKKELAYIGYGGTGKQVRDILHINDLFQLIDYQIQNFSSLNGEMYNVGGGIECSISLLELTKICQEIIGNTIDIVPVKDTRSADLRIYVTDNTKITKKTGWKPKSNPQEIITDIFEWIKRDEKILNKILN